MKAAIAELEQRKAGLVAEIEKLDRAIAVLVELEGGAPPKRGLTVVRGKKAPAKAPRAPKVEAKKKRGRTSETVVANAQAIAERDGLKAASTRLGIPYGTLYAWSRKGKWKLPDARHQRSGPPPAAKGPGRGKRRAPGTECPNCHITSPENPCSCGTAKKVPA